MLEMMVEKQMLLVITGIFTVLGVGSKCIVNLSLKRLVYGAENMNKSTHPFIRLVRAKFEHACMISEKVENVSAFVDKYLYEYRVCGIHLHTLRRMESMSALMCGVCGVTGGFLLYIQAKIMTEAVLRTGAAGIGAGIFVFLFHLTTDENYRLRMIRNYMVDYLENICLHRYEKAYRKEQPVVEEKAVVPANAVVEKETAEDESTKKEIMRDENIKIADLQTTEEKEEVVKEEKEEMDKDARIRQILEEFMA